MIKRPGVIKGGFYPKNSTSAPCPSVVIAVEDLTEAMKNVTDAGGKILGEPGKSRVSDTMFLSMIRKGIE